MADVPKWFGRYGAVPLVFGPSTTNEILYELQRGVLGGCRNITRLSVGGWDDGFHNRVEDLIAELSGIILIQDRLRGSAQGVGDMEILSRLVC